jgi:hypothetical protein
LRHSLITGFAVGFGGMRHLRLIGLAVGVLIAAVATSAAAFDARNPTDVLAVLSANGASGDLKKDEKGKPYIDAKAGTLGFEVDFYDCDDKGAVCATTLYTTGWNMSSVTIEQINRWNRWTVLCPAYLNSENHPHAWYALKPSVNEARSDVAVELGGWLDCLSDFDKFTDDPEVFLKAHE